MNQNELLDYYKATGPFTTIAGFEDQVDALPDDIGKIAHAVQMLLVHRGWAPAYGLTLTPEQETENGLHSTEAMLKRAMQKDPARIAVLGRCSPRPCRKPTCPCESASEPCWSSARPSRLLEVVAW